MVTTPENDLPERRNGKGNGGAFPVPVAEIIGADDEALALPRERIGKPRTFRDCVVGFLGTTRNPNTLNAYAYDVEDFLRFLDARGIGRDRAHEIDRAVADAYVLALVNGGARPATVRRRLSVLRNLYDYALDAGVVAFPPPFRKVKAPRGKAEPRNPGVSLDELPALLEAAAAEGRTARAVVVLGAVLGLRASEMLDLSVEDLGKEGKVRTLRVHGKGGKEATVPVPDAVYDALRPLVRRRKSGPILRKDGKALDYQALYYVVRKVAARAGLGKRSPHDLRRAAVMAALDLGVSVPEARDLMRHASIETTMRYDVRRKALESSPVFLLAETILGGKR